MSHPHDDLPRDPWLQQALRHAPDHGAAVPEAVRDTILTAARAAVRRPQPAPPRRWWQGWWPQSTPTRLGYSGALMALLVVGLWGVDRLEQPAAVPERREVLAVPAAASADSAAPAVASASPAAAYSPAAAAKPAAPGVTPTANGLRREAAAKAERRQASARDAAPATPPTVASAEPAPAAELQPAPATARPETQAGTARERLVEVAPPPAPAPAPAPAAAAAPATAPPPAPVATHTPTLALAPAATPRMAKAATAGPSQAEAVVANPLAQARLAWRLQPDLAWQTATGRQGPQGPAQAAWLARLQQALGGPWQVAAQPPGPPTVQWPDRGGAQLWLAPEGQVWLARAGEVHTAPLPAAEAAALLDLLADWR